MNSDQEQIKNRQMMAKIAEYKISAELLSHDIITVKPDVDLYGADILAIMQVKDGAKFARIQCKGRTLKDPKPKSTIEIKKSYVKGTFTLLLYIQYNNEKLLLCFFANDIKNSSFWKEYKEDFKLHINGKDFKKRFKLFMLNDAKMNLLKQIIRESDVEKEFYNLFLESKLPVLKLTASMSESD